MGPRPPRMGPRQRRADRPGRKRVPAGRLRPQHQAVRRPRRRPRRDVLWKAHRSRLPPVVLLLPRPPPPLAAPRRRPSRQAQRQCRDRAGRDRACRARVRRVQQRNQVTPQRIHRRAIPGLFRHPPTRPRASSQRAADRQRRGGSLAEPPAAEPECTACPARCGGLAADRIRSAAAAAHHAAAPPRMAGPGAASGVVAFAAPALAPAPEAAKMPPPSSSWPAPPPCRRGRPTS